MQSLGSSLAPSGREQLRPPLGRRTIPLIPELHGSLAAHPHAVHSFPLSRHANGPPAADPDDRPPSPRSPWPSPERPSGEATRRHRLARPRPPRSTHGREQPARPGQVGARRRRSRSRWWRGSCRRPRSSPARPPGRSPRGSRDVRPPPATRAVRGIPPAGPSVQPRAGRRAAAGGSTARHRGVPRSCRRSVGGCRTTSTRSASTRAGAPRRGRNGGRSGRRGSPVEAVWTRLTTGAKFGDKEYCCPHAADPILWSSRRGSSRIPRSHQRTGCGSFGTLLCSPLCSRVWSSSRTPAVPNCRSPASPRPGTM